jgi:hypothetical protein
LTAEATSSAVSVLPDGSQHAFLLIPNRSVPLPPSSTQAFSTPGVSSSSVGTTANPLAILAAHQNGITATAERRFLLSHIH